MTQQTTQLNAKSHPYRVVLVAGTVIIHVIGLTGILMCGLSTGFFFAVVSRVYEPRRDKDILT